MTTLRSSKIKVISTSLFTKSNLFQLWTFVTVLCDTETSAIDWTYWYLRSPAWTFECSCAWIWVDQDIEAIWTPFELTIIVILIFSWVSWNSWVFERTSNNIITCTSKIRSACISCRSTSWVKCSEIRRRSSSIVTAVHVKGTSWHILPTFQQIHIRSKWSSKYHKDNLNLSFVTLPSISWPFVGNSTCKITQCI